MDINEESWQEGKTAASIQFVADANRELPELIDAEDRTLLAEAIEEVKRGDLGFLTEKPPRVYLAQFCT